MSRGPGRAFSVLGAFENNLHLNRIAKQGSTGMPLFSRLQPVSTCLRVSKCGGWVSPPSGATEDTAREEGALPIDGLHTLG